MWIFLYETWQIALGIGTTFARSHAYGRADSDVIYMYADVIYSLHWLAQHMVVVLIMKYPCGDFIRFHVSSVLNIKRENTENASIIWRV